MDIHTKALFDAVTVIREQSAYKLRNEVVVVDLDLFFKMVDAHDALNFAASLYEATKHD